MPSNHPSNPERVFEIKEQDMSFKASPALLTAAIILLGSSAYAERYNTVITAPGMKLEKKQGWFGSGKTSYSDAMGNHYNHSRGWFGLGGDREDSRILGTQVQQSWGGTSVKSADGSTLVETKKTLFGLGPTRREIHGDKIWDAIKNLGNVSNASNVVTPSSNYGNSNNYPNP